MSATTPAFSARHNDVAGVQTINNALAITIFSRLTLQIHTAFACVIPADVSGFQSSVLSVHCACGYSRVERKRSALQITETELKLIAAPAIIGLRRSPKNG
jgi:hypothetical protein